MELKRALIKVVPNSVIRKVSRRILLTRKQSPTIFFAVGVAGTVVSTVLACRATLKLSETLDEIQADLDQHKELKHVAMDVNETKYPMDEWNKDAVYIYAKGTFKLAKLYAPAIAVGTISIACLTGSHVQLLHRNTALMAAYAAIQKAYEDYRERVQAEVGPERELDLYHGVSKQIVKDEDGKDKELKVVDPNKFSAYARFFDEYSANWKKNPELNRIFIQCQQNYANVLLQANGHLFLNEVYDMLGIERSRAGAVVGWVIGKDGDNYVDFGLFDCDSSRFVNGWERSILLDFNVDGVIWDKI
jgi:Family of unknown function (DUF6353)